MYHCIGHIENDGSRGGKEMKRKENCYEESRFIFNMMEDRWTAESKLGATLLSKIHFTHVFFMFFLFFSFLVFCFYLSATKS